MDPSIEYEGAINDILKDVSVLLEQPEKTAKKALNEIGVAVKANVTMTAPVSDKTYFLKGDHIANDVVYKVKKSRKTKEQYVTISGGKKTWQKWHVVNDGHIAKNGDFVQGNHFVDKATAMSEIDIDVIINRWCGEIVNNESTN